MKGRRLAPTFLVFCVGLALLMSGSGSAIGAARMLALSLSHAGLSADEWIGGYECTLLGIRVVAIRDVPYVWSTKIINETAGRAEVYSQHVLGTGPMGKDPIKELQELFVLKRTTRAEKALPVGVNCELLVENFHNDDVKFVKLGTKQFSFQPVERIPAPEPPYQPDLRWFVVSIPPLSLASNERIVMFELEVKAGRVVSLKNIPDLWFVSATNSDAGSFTGIYGETLANSAALGRNDLGVFDRFVTVEWHAEDAPYFPIRAKIKIKAGPGHYRYVRLHAPQLILSPVSYSAKGTNPSLSH